MAIFYMVGRGWLQVSRVKPTELCPSASETTLALAPAISLSLAKVCLRSWKRHFSPTLSAISRKDLASVSGATALKNFRLFRRVTDRKRKEYVMPGPILEITL